MQEEQFCVADVTAWGVPEHNQSHALIHRSCVTACNASLELELQVKEACNQKLRQNYTGIAVKSSSGCHAGTPSPLALFNSGVVSFIAGSVPSNASPLDVSGRASPGCQAGTRVMFPSLLKNPH